MGLTEEIYSSTCTTEQQVKQSVFLYQLKRVCPLRGLQKNINVCNVAPVVRAETLKICQSLAFRVKSVFSTVITSLDYALNILPSWHFFTRCLEGVFDHALFCPQAQIQNFLTRVLSIVEGSGFNQDVC